MGERTIETRMCSLSPGPSFFFLLIPQIIAPAGQTASVMDVMAVSAAPAPAKAARETIASAILPSATVPTRKKPAASETTSFFQKENTWHEQCQHFESCAHSFVLTLSVHENLLFHVSF